MTAGAGTRHVAVSGSSGLIGSALCAALAAAGDRVSRLVRDDGASSRPDEIVFLPEAGRIDRSRLRGVDAVVHLAGEGIAAGRWTAERKRRIRDSRVRGTRLLATALAGLEAGPEVLISASAIGFYGDRGDDELDEASEPGEGFLPETCVEWEGETAVAARAGVRVVLLRSGLVLSARGGALAKMLGPFRLGLGGRLGHGGQFVSWIALRDVIAILLWLLADRAISGPVNAVAPTPVRNEEFTRVLAGVIGRPAIIPAPAFVLRALLGEMGRELLLASTRVYPARLERAGYRFLDPELDGALRYELGR
ncbi:MAG TPA: TIGR01777 family oxidoreductase [Candidatus Polarisedimenticolaceae bacterium]|nr:TIGR01777 family oxidoreductase [Candidatus Polarisedimenticolaceae bacterium]